MKTRIGLGSKEFFWAASNLMDPLEQAGASAIAKAPLSTALENEPPASAKGFDSAKSHTIGIACFVKVLAIAESFGSQVQFVLE